MTKGTRVERVPWVPMQCLTRQSYLAGRYHKRALWHLPKGNLPGDLSYGAHAAHRITMHPTAGGCPSIVDSAQLHIG